MSNVRSCQRALTVLVAGLCLSSLLAAQEKKEFRYNVGRRALVSITNNYGPVTVSPSRADQVDVTTVSYSNAVTFENEQHGNRIELRAVSSRQSNSLANYSVVVPSDAFLTVRSSDAEIHARGLQGDIILEAVGGTVEATDINNAHLHVRTLSGQVTLSDIRDSHIDIHSVSGNVNLRDVSGSSLEVSSGSGRIMYEGDPGRTGEYLLVSHSGDLEVSIPASAAVEIKAHSVKGESDEQLPNSGNGPATAGSLLLKPGVVNASRFVLRSFRGKIHVKRP